MAGTTKNKVGAPSTPIIDRVLEYIAPGAASRRELARLQLSRTRSARRYVLKREEQIQRRKYESAQVNRLRNASRSKGSGNAVAGSAIVALRQLARSFEENYDLASGVLRTMTSKIVGRGITVIPTIKTIDGDLAEELNDKVAALCKIWNKNPEVTGKYKFGKAQRMAALSWLRDGEQFTRFLKGNVSGLVHGSEVPFSIQLLEADHVPVGLVAESPRGLSNGAYWYGIDEDDWGRPTKYHIYRQHPGKPGAFLIHNDDLIQVEPQDVAHLSMCTRIGQTRGVSVFANTMSRLEDLRDVEESERVAARVASAIALAIHRDGTSNSEGDATPTELDFVQGMIFDGLAEGEKIDTLDHRRPNNQVPAFRKDQLRSVSAGTGAGFSSISKCYDGTYSAQRQELVEQDEVYAALRDDFVSDFVEPVHCGRIEMMLLAGLIPGLMLENVDINTLKDAEYRGPRVAYINPQQEVQAQVIAIDKELTSKAAVIMERGDDPREVSKQIAAEKPAKQDRPANDDLDTEPNEEEDDDAGNGNDTDE